MKINTLKLFEEYIQAKIPRREDLFIGDIGIRRAKYFLKLLGDPQDKIKVVHIAGTSGKGSTATLTSHILESQGFRVGISLSPHVFDIRERMQIDNKLPDEEIILKYFNKILPLIEQMEKSKYGSPTFFEINVGLAYYMFWKENLDYAVMETGLGGTLDATNCVTNKNKLCIITKIGLDHTDILGKTIEQIAEQKAGIIQRGNLVISHQSSAIAKSVIAKKCEEKNADLQFITKRNYKVISSNENGIVFDYRNGLKNIDLNLLGIHQAENCSLALACLFALSERYNFKVDEDLLRSKLRNIKIPGRMEIRKLHDKTVILDGAHNPQKMQTFVLSLKQIYPNQKFVFILAFKKGKEHKGMLKYILPLAEKIYLSEFSLSNQDNLHSSVSSEEIVNFLKNESFNNFEIISNDNILNKIKKEKKPIVITGSLYFIGSLNLSPEKSNLFY